MTKRLTRDEFLSKAKVEHGSRYIYDNTEYRGLSKKIAVICREHGEYSIAAANHLRGQGCRLCGAKTRARSKTLSHEDVIARFIDRHGDRYIYDKTKYVSMRERVTITCRIHGDFQQLPSEHLKGNCKRCSASTVTEIDFVDKATLIHGGKYSYDNSGFTLRGDKVFVTCPEHGKFETVAHAHLKGHGCRECAEGSRVGWTRRKYIEFCMDRYKGDSILYVVKMACKEYEFYKVGLSVGGSESRFKFERNKYKITKILEAKGAAGSVWDTEQILKRRFKENRITWKTKLKSGHTECFTDIDLDAIIAASEESGLSVEAFL